MFTTDLAEIGKEDVAHVEESPRETTPVDFETLSRESIDFKSKAALRLLLVLIVQGFSVASFGVDYGVISGVVTMKSFRDYFDVELSGSKFGVIVAAVYIGNFFGSALVWLADYIGRRGLTVLGCALTIVGALIQVIQPTSTKLLVGRLFTGGGGAMTATIAPMYINEISPACWRGLLAGANAACTYIGTISIGLVIIGCSYLKTDWSWKIPLLFQLFNPVVAIALVYFVTPESPRYLLYRGQEGKARTVIAKYHTTSEDENSPLVVETIAQIKDSLSISTAKPWDFSPLYKTKFDRYRLLIIFLYSMFQQWYGGALFSYYLPSVLNLVGIKHTRSQLGFNLGYSALTIISAFIGASFFDRTRRRPLLMGAMLAFAFLLTLMTICSALFVSTKNSTLGYLIVVWVYLFSIVKGTTVIPMHNIYPAETLHYSQRAKGMSAYSLFQALFGIAITYGASAAIKIIGWKIYIVFIAFDICFCIVTYFMFPEYKGLTLEEIDFIYETPDVNPVKLSLEIQKDKGRLQHDVRNI